MSSAAGEFAVPSRGGSEVGHRLLEAVPGLTSWTLLLAPAWIAILTGSLGLDGPYWIAVAVLIFDVYWLARSLFVIFGIYRTWFRLRRDMATDWLARCAEADGVGDAPQPLDYYHLAIIPTY